MTIKPGFMLREVGGTHVMVAIGQAARAFRGVAYLNETGAAAFRALKEGDSQERVAQRLADEFDIDRETAARDVAAMLKQLVDDGIAEE